MKPIKYHTLNCLTLILNTSKYTIQDLEDWRVSINKYSNFEHNLTRRNLEKDDCEHKPFSAIPCNDIIVCPISFPFLNFLKQIHLDPFNLSSSVSLNLISKCWNRFKIVRVKMYYPLGPFINYVTQIWTFSNPPPSPLCHTKMSQNH